MRKIGRFIFSFTLALSLIFLSSTMVNAQAMVSYLYLEVVDSNQMPVADATIETSALNPDPKTERKTDSSGSARFESWNRPPDPSTFRILKQDYYPFELFGLLKYPFRENGFYEYRNLKI